MAPLRTIAETSARNGPSQSKLTTLEKIKEAEKQDNWDGGSITKRYHRLRVEEVPGFLKSLGENGREKLRVDADRVKWCRARLEKSEENRLLFEEVHESFKQWRSEAESTRRVQFIYTADKRAEHCKDPDVLPKGDTNRLNRAVGDTDPAHDFKAGFLFFQRYKTGWKKATHHGHGFDKQEKFPNQKITIKKALSGKDNPFSETKDENGERHLKYIQLPANHMGWVEDAIARYYGEDHHEEKQDRRMTNQTLAREFWQGQVHGGGPDKHPIHTRHLRTRCLSIPLVAGSEAGASFQFQKPEQRRKNFAIFLPYLHWEMYGRKARMAETVQKIIKGVEPSANAGKRVEHFENDELRNLNEHHRERFGQVIPKSEPTENVEDTARKTIDQWKRFKRHVKSKLGIYLVNVAKLWEPMDTEAEERLLRDGLDPKRAGTDHSRGPALHIRRTLDQSYFLNLVDTSRRDRDQVVYRATRLPWRDPGNLIRIVMVDQLWMWILDDYTIITAFPRRWGRNKPDSSGIHKCLRDRLDRVGGEVTSVWHLASIIIDQCSRVFFDRTKPLDLRPEVMDLFAESLNDVNEHTTRAFEAFWREAELEESGTRRPNPRYLCINPAGTLLREAQDIAEELRMMNRIYAQQLGAVDDFRKSLQRWNKQRPNIDYRKSENTTDATRGDTSADLEILEEMTEQIGVRKAEIDELAGAAERSCQNVKAQEPIPNVALKMNTNHMSWKLQGLLALKQQQASIVEAKAALERADDGLKQGKSIMAFTIMTIIFTPLGFFTSFFGMNNSSTGQDWMPLWQQILTMIGISAVITSVFLAVAFKEGLRSHSKTIRKKIEVTDKTDTIKASLQRIPGVSKLRQQVQDMRRGNAGDSFIDRWQKRRHGSNPTDSFTIVPGQSAEHGNWETGDNKCCV